MRVRPSWTASIACSASGLTLDVPLQRQVRLDDRLAAVALAHRIAVVVDLLQQPLVLQVGDHVGARLEALHAPGTGAAVLVDDPGLVEDVDGRQVVAQADLEVVEVVGRGDLDHAGAELAIDVLVGDDRDLAVDQRQHHRLADQVW